MSSPGDRVEISILVETVVTEAGMQESSPAVKEGGKVRTRGLLPFLLAINGFSMVEVLYDSTSYDFLCARGPPVLFFWFWATTSAHPLRKANFFHPTT